MKMTLTAKQYEAYRKVTALRELTRENGVVTTRSQNAVLQALSDEDLAAVAAALTAKPGEIEEAT